ncbi:phenylalanine--tRNA ligase subunit beta [Psychromonas sp. psych-6C06]|uniref:phenylalanine--tRNA ligase subunit beta n=1 Tax=Psychromonas sp. psych-6C06 TaxID=2058089 RepID=UPI000C341763|nr:phenylalanine--tRNA ligase subunit beta [Psychromonas sp. psych-6C06]PKF63687.1 phenylalanine--tRNA ligase subunit beta [Psychromonas sp. psych-6C06]
MKFSEAWLREWVNPEISSADLQHQITMAGLEVDDVDAVAGEFTKVLVGEVVECGQHPDADKLQVTKINIGEDELIDIVCGAKNCRLGLKVAVAVVGAVLPGDFKIKKAKLRGQPSFGMLCSESELGMAESAEGIIELPLDAPIGQCVREYLQLDDVTIDVDLTANRADCLGIAGLAREVGVLNAISATEPTWENVAVSIDDTVAINLQAPQACPRYLGRVIKGINQDVATPLWMVEKLRRCGVRSVDAVVDITQYVLLEFGHPMHAFDLTKLEGGIEVRLAEQDEKLTLLDGKEVKLNADTLVIADQSKALAMAGIFGGQDSGVQQGTTDIFLESAFFAPLAIAGRARSYGLHTDASHRYERGVDPVLQAKAMERATQLLVEICGGSVGPITEAVSNENLPKQATITLTRVKLDRLIGHVVEDARVTEILTQLGCDVETTENSWTVVAPTYRFDMEIEEDLIEEVARVYGYNNIPNIAPQAALTMPAHNEAALKLSKIRDVLVNREFNEAITYSFVDPDKQLKLHPEADALILPHPISKDMSAMRVSLLTGLLESVSKNQKRQQPRVRLFETGLRFVKDENAENGINQQAMLAGVIIGNLNEQHWDLESRNVDFFDLKADLESVLDLCVDSTNFEFKAETHSALHPGQSAGIYRNGKHIGYIGALHPNHVKPFAIKGTPIVFEVLLDAISTRQLPEAGDISKFPANHRDLAFVVDKKVDAGKVLKFIDKIGGTQLVGLNLFDVYEGQGVIEGNKSLAIGLILQDTTRTLEEQEIADSVNAIVEAVSKEFNASLRE